MRILYYCNAFLCRFAICLENFSNSLEFFDTSLTTNLVFSPAFWFHLTLISYNLLYLLYFFVSSKDQDVDKHPEKRLKAAYAAFEERRLRELKEANSTLRLSQLKQLIFKEWQKSPENPLNKAWQGMQANLFGITKKLYCNINKFVYKIWTD